MSDPEGLGDNEDWHQKYRDFLLYHYEKMADLYGSDIAPRELLDSCEVTLTSYHGNEYPGITALLRDRSETDEEKKN
ncbi:MAG: hypothetical protein K6F86_13360 [Lachnospiraceae bacterium]|nr:hypothetical protein [Lachnospiraceae bacterium]